MFRKKKKPQPEAEKKAQDIHYDELQKEKGAPNSEEKKRPSTLDVEEHAIGAGE